MRYCGGLSFLVLWAVISAVFSPVGVAADEYIEPDQVKISTPVYVPSSADFKPRLGEYLYTVGWQGIPAADAILKVEREGLVYKITAKMKTYRLIDVFYRLRTTAIGKISAIDFSPISFTMDHREKSRIKNVLVDFGPDGNIYARREQKGKGSEEITFHSDNYTLDPFAAAFIARGVDWSDGQTKLFDTFNGKSRYLIKLTPERKEKMEINGEVRDVWVISPAVNNLSKPEQDKKLRDADIYLTADSQREIVKIRSSVFVGSVTTSLESFTPAAEQPANTEYLAFSGHGKSHTRR